MPKERSREDSIAQSDLSWSRWCSLSFGRSLYVQTSLYIFLCYNSLTTRTSIHSTMKRKQWSRREGANQYWLYPEEEAIVSGCFIDSTWALEKTRGEHGKQTRRKRTSNRLKWTTKRERETWIDTRDQCPTRQLVHRPPEINRRK